ncbi:nucleotide sugar dehydrogenase [Pseudopedobacter saltans DSM 12145]|uniref:Nucleotide sugar dehydrogenase n=1 Tax=Pseudopedobacter saltans (strain ATCC 51119 / DSM 12145 / JCM 21818 / CCUG 39354 / LMG 10337 / NBRC 100064 / NCIMB 13643) TaxID=762903 RepID=F0SBD7_PSESL|nr:nucleotide sugar dehydrogenase [Pseudopedobacter saltans]ADY53764.1 nucleotide sugar dehydrogenase [Pseudopedobacter saltans DSM 12145]
MLDHQTDKRIAVLGLGYVGLPLACLFATKYPVVGFDIDEERIAALRGGYDRTGEVEKKRLLDLTLSETPFFSEHEGIYFSADIESIRSANVYIITVPTPVDKNNHPDMRLLFKASEIVGKVISNGDVVIYESTVYPGATEEDCVPIIESVSGLNYNKDFFVGYSPERINPGDRERTVEKIRKITSGSNPQTALTVDELYKSVIVAGTYLAPTIKVAEAAKVIENSQRDINIAFVNELAIMFNLMGIDTQEVLAAAGTKWNFLPFKPGLVGGHCIGVDPYYLAQKAQQYGYHPEILLAGRRLNDAMGEYVASQIVKCMVKKDINIKGAEVLMLGFTFKENCSDVRNTKVIDIVENLMDYGLDVVVYDPYADHAEVEKQYGVKCQSSLDTKKYDALVLAVAHQEFETIRFGDLKKDKSIIYDVKGLLPYADGRL